MEKELLRKLVITIILVSFVALSATAIIGNAAAQTPEQYVEFYGFQAGKEGVESVDVHLSYNDMASSDNLAPQDIIVTFTINDGTAKNGLDYSWDPSTNTVVIPAGKSSADIYIPVIDDSEFEPVETLTITLLEAHFADNQPVAIGDQDEFELWIVDNDDVTPPVTTCSLDPAVPDGDNGWYRSDVTVTLTAEDPSPGCGVWDIAYWFGDNYPISYDSTAKPVLEDGQYTLTYRSMDYRDNREEPKTYPGLIKIDTTLPVVSVIGISDNAVYAHNQPVTVEWSASDSLSGLASSSGSLPSGSQIDTSEAGVYEFTVTAVDNAGNINKVTYHYTVNAPTPIEATAEVKTEVMSLDLPAAIETGLSDHLDAATAAINKGNKKAARNTLNAFINQVMAQSGKALTSAEADALISEAQTIINSL